MGTFDKDRDRALAHRARMGARIWGSEKTGTGPLNLGRNARKRRAREAAKAAKK